ncbi:MAG: type II toxin-antitoxin system Phd/YefM family antitoxin [Candidatus Rhabdochlamydia sp.]
MDAVPCSRLRTDLKFFIDKVCDSHEPLIVTRERGENAVLMSLEDYNSMEETAYILSNPATAARLRKAIEEANAGNVIMKDIKEFDV